MVAFNITSIRALNGASIPHGGYLGLLRVPGRVRETSKFSTVVWTDFDAGATSKWSQNHPKCDEKNVYEFRVCFCLAAETTASSIAVLSSTSETMARYVAWLRDSLHSFNLGGWDYSMRCGSFIFIGWDYGMRIGLCNLSGWDYGSRINLWLAIFRFSWGEYCMNADFLHLIFDILEH